VRGFYSAAAGALWPAILVGAAQVYAVRYIARQFRPTPSKKLELAPLATVGEMSLHP
jgi:hypothetical protein